MNFSQRKVKQKMKQLKSPATHRVHKLKVMGVRTAIVGFLLVAFFSVSAFIGSFQSILQSSPDIDSVHVVPQGYTTEILDSKGKLMQTLVGKDANREYVTLDKIPQDLQDAFVAIEDQRFWTHKGIDITGILRAFSTGLANGGNFSQGASTLTQQLLKNQVFNGGQETTFYKQVERKLQEQYLAIQLEKKFSKEQILEYYLNTINLGQNTLGVQAASKRYFNKDVSTLTLSECAVLAGITQNPTAYNPITHPVKNGEKRTTVLAYMKEQGYITTEEYSTAITDAVYKRIKKVNNKTEQRSSTTSYFTDALIEQVIYDLKHTLGYTETQAYNALYSGGLTIYSTQDSKIQKKVDKIINNPKYYPKDSSYQLTYQLTLRHKDTTESTYTFDTMKKWYAQKGKNISQYYKKKKTAKALIKKYKKAMVKGTDTILAEATNFIIQPQVSFVLMDQYTGSVKAICGGRGEKYGSRTLNRATDSTRQPGSTFKILSTYLPALDTAGMTLASVQDDSKYYYPGTKRQVKNWYGESYRGLTSMRRAIADSMNVVAVKTLEQVTPKIGYDYLLNLGLTTLVNNYTNSSGMTFTDIALPMALGGLTKGVTNLELTNAFATIANGGAYHTPAFYTKIVNHDGIVLIDKTKEASQQVIKDSTAWLLTDSMQDVISNGTGGALKFQSLAMPQAGKTGTSTDNKDLWFVGYTPYFTAGIWGGYDANLKQIETTYHKEIWRTIMESINKGYTKKTFKRPSSVTTAVICTKCGKLAVDGLCSDAIGGSCAMQEYFAKDCVPTEICTCHVRYQICRSSNRLAGETCPSSQIYSKVYLQKNETGVTSDSSLLLPPYLKSSCTIH